MKEPSEYWRGIQPIDTHTTFGTIRSVGVDNKNRDRTNRFYCVRKKHYDQLNFGYDTFIRHITNPKKDRVWFK